MRRFTSVLLLLALSGCFQEELTVAVQSDGRGTLTVHHKAGKNPLGDLFSFGDASPEQKANTLAAEQLARYAGIVAWTDVKAQVGDDGRVEYWATGWFEDLGAVRRAGEKGGGMQWVCERDGEQLRVTLVDTGGVDAGGMGTTLEDVLTDPLDEVRKQRAGMPFLMRGVLASFRSSVTIELPAGVEGEGWTTREGNTVTLVRDAGWASDVVKQQLEGGLAIRKRLDAGELTLEQAQAELVALSGEVDRHAVSCQGPFAADPAFAARMEEATAAWATSPWNRLIADTRQRLAEEAERDVRAMDLWKDDSIETPPPVGLDRSEPDRFEPNDTQRKAPLIGPDVYPNLLADSEDWYRVDVPGAFQLRVKIRYDQRQGSLSLSLYGEDGLEVADGDPLGDHEEQLVFAPGKSGTLFIQVLNFSKPLPYHLEVELLPFRAADRFEPNDTEELATPLEPGSYPKLACTAADYYLLEVPAGAVLSVEIEPVEGGEDVRGMRVAVTQPGEGRYTVPDTLGHNIFEPNDLPRLTCRGTGKPLTLEVRPGWSRDGNGSWPQGRPYALTVTVREDPQPDALEPNQTRKTAHALEPGSYPELTTDPRDWYQVRIPADKQLRLSFQSEARLELKLYDWEQRQPILGRDGRSGGFVFGTGQAQAVFVELEGYGLVPYALEVELEDYQPQDPFEPNDAREQATPVQAGRFADLVCTSADWYQLELEEGQTLAVSAHQERRSLTVEILDPLGMQVVESKAWDDQPATYAAAAPGTYYVRVTPNSRGDWGAAYALELDVSGP